VADSGGAACALGAEWQSVTGNPAAAASPAGDLRPRIPASWVRPARVADSGGAACALGAECHPLLRNP